MANERRVREGFRSGTVANNPLAMGDTSLDFGSDPGFATIDSTKHAAIILDPLGANGAPEIVYLTAFTAAGTTGTILRAQEGTTARSHPAGTVWRHGATGRDFPKAPVWGVRTAGDVAIGTNWTAITLDAGDDVSGGDLVLPAYPGDVILVGMNIIWNSGTTTDLTADVACMVTAGANSWFGNSGGFGASTGFGPMAWYTGTAGVEGVYGAWPKTIVAGDIENGVVTLRPAIRRGGSARTVQADTSYRFEIWAQNMGPKAA